MMSVAYSFSLTVFQIFKNVINILSSWGICKQVVCYIWRMDFSLLAPVSDKRTVLGDEYVIYLSYCYIFIKTFFLYFLSTNLDNISQHMKYVCNHVSEFCSVEWGWKWRKAIPGLVIQASCAILHACWLSILWLEWRLQSSRGWKCHKVGGPWVPTSHHGRLPTEHCV